MADVRTEPSMEEILASIKRIIADDGQGAPAAPRADTDESAYEAVFETPPEPAEPAVAPAPPAARHALAEAVAPSPPPPPVDFAAPPPRPEPAATEATLVSDGAALASRQALSSLALLSRPAQGETTLDGMVREMLRPMLREWLDAKLPGIVETLVAREIARITGQGD
ncbi:MAG: DUF2497 domain-containing protein [Sphingomonas sp.]